MFPVFFAPIAVATIYTLWHIHYRTIQQQRQTLRERVAYMLWMAAQQAE